MTDKDRKPHESARARSHRRVNQRLRDAISKEASDDLKDLEIPPKKLDWMKRTYQWGVKADLTDSGLTLGALNVGIYGEIPDRWDDQSRMPRGAYPMPGVPPIGNFISEKRDLWSDNSADLYEEAIQRRWAPATDIPWESIEPLPDDVEAAVCQLCTVLCQHANTEIETLGSWLHQMSYGYHEVKLFLATEMFDAARHFEVFRKRALSNGGGLGLELKGDVKRMIIESRGGWSETALLLYLLRGLFTFTIYRYGSILANNDAEKAIFEKSVQDKARHLSYGIEHLRYAMTRQDDKNLVFSSLLGIGERLVSRECREPIVLEPLAVIFGGGVSGAHSGMKVVQRLMSDYVNLYLSSLKFIGIDRLDSLSDDFKSYLL